MKINIRGEKLEITKAMREYAEEKLSKLNKYIDDSENVTANMLVKLRDNKQKVETTILLKSLILRTEEVQEDFYAAIDTSITKLERQLRKNKTKLQSKHRINKELVFDYEYEEEEPTETIVKRKTVSVKPMDEEEAMLQMELLGHQFYLYKDAETNKATVIYKRKDGNYGIIEAE